MGLNESEELDDSILCLKNRHKNHRSNARDFYLNRDYPISQKIFKKEKCIHFKRNNYKFLKKHLKRIAIILRYYDINSSLL